MSRRLTTGLLGSILALAAVAGAAQPQTAQTPQRDTRPQPGTPAPSGTAALSGTVVAAADASKRVRLAPVVIIGTSTGVLRVASTDADGRFSFTGLPADRYLVGASKPPYLGAVAGAKRPARPGTPIALADGQKITNVTIQLPMGAAISGVVIDERGQPAPSVTVNLMQARMQNGERVLTLGPGGTSTDEHGRYRMFGLPPGEYLVVASARSFSSASRTLTDAEVDAALKAPMAPPPGGIGSAPGASAAPAPPPPSSPPVAYAPVFFPGTTRASDAAPIALGVGEDRQGVDFRLELVRTAKIEGTVTGMEAQPPGSVSVVRASSQMAGGSAGTMSVSRVLPEGKFTMPNLAPGSYTLIASAAGGPVPLFATATVDVMGTDQSAIQLNLQPALSFAARIAFAGNTPAPALAGYRIPLRSAPPVIFGAQSPQVALTNGTGVSQITGVVPGRYIIGGPLFFGATQASLTWALESVVVDGKDVTDVPLNISADAVPKEVVVTYGDRSQELSGRLQQSSGAPATDYTIVVFPADKAYWIPGSRRILTTRSGTDGQYRLGGPGLITLPAGDYLLAAVSELDKDEQFDPAFLTSLQAAAVRVTLQPGEKKTQNLAIR